MTLRVAIVGCGYFSQFHREAWGRMADVLIAGLADQDPARLAAAAAPFLQARTFVSAEAMLDAVQPDLVDIVTPPASHHALVAAATARGIPAICQKPLAPSYAEAVTLVETAEAAGVLLVVHENFRFRRGSRRRRGSSPPDRSAGRSTSRSRCGPATGKGRGPISTGSPTSRKWSGS